MSDLRAKVCVITGGSSGIGLAAARAWAAEGAAVVLLARGAGRLKQAADAIRAEGGEAHHVVADVGRAEDAERVACFVGELAGRVDVLFNNAGVLHEPKPLCELPIEVVDEVWCTNVRGILLMTRALLPLLSVRPGAQIINTTSGLKRAPRYGAYSVSKSAVDALTAVLAAELAPDIRVNAFNPGWVRTNMAPDAPDPVERVVPRLLELARMGADGPTGQEIHA